MTTLHSIIEDLIGTYSPIISEQTYIDSAGETIHVFVSSPDWSWIGSCLIFALVIYSMFKVLGLMFRG